MTPRPRSLSLSCSLHSPDVVRVQTRLVSALRRPTARAPAAGRPATSIAGDTGGPPGPCRSHGQTPPRQDAQHPAHSHGLRVPSLVLPPPSGHLRFQTRLPSSTIFKRDFRHEPDGTRRGQQNCGNSSWTAPSRRHPSGRQPGAMGRRRNGPRAQHARSVRERQRLHSLHRLL